MQWIRLYTELLDDPKVQRLPDPQFKLWINLLLIAGRNDGALPGYADLAFALRITEKEAIRHVGALEKAGLVDREGDALSPHNWHARQYKSDSSTERSRRFRERKGDASCNDAATLRATAAASESGAPRDVAATDDETALARKRDGPTAVARTAAGTPPESESESESESSSSDATPLPSDDDDGLRNRLRRAAGGNVHALCLDVTPIKTLMGQGFDLETVILPAIAASVPFLKRKLQMWGARFLRDKIAEVAEARRKAPAGPTAAAAIGRFVAKSSPLWPKRAARYRKLRGADPPEMIEGGVAGLWFPLAWFEADEVASEVSTEAAE